MTEAQSPPPTIQIEARGLRERLQGTIAQADVDWVAENGIPESSEAQVAWAYGLADAILSALASRPDGEGSPHQAVFDAEGMCQCPHHFGSSPDGDTQPGAEGAVVARLAEAEAELQRLRDAEWSDMSDAELGRCFKAFAASVEAHSAKEWRGDAEMRLGLMNLGLMQAIKMAAESNAETFVYRATGFHSEGVQHGDWSVTFARQQPPASPGEVA